LRSLSGPSSGIRSLAISPDERTLASGDDYGDVKLWDVASGCEVRTLPDSRRAHYLVFSKDGTQLAAAQDRYVVIWRAAPMNEVTVAPAETTEEPAVPDNWRTLDEDTLGQAKLLRDIQDHRISSVGGRGPTGKSLLSDRQWKFYLVQSTGAKAVNTVDANGLITCNVLHTAPVFYYIQAYQPGLPLEAGRPYVLQFRARSVRKSWVVVSVTRDVAPYDIVGMSKHIHVTSQWTPFRFQFQATRLQPDHGSLTFGLGDVPGKIQLSDVQLAPVDGR
jgi:hypothetical protein